MIFQEEYDLSKHLPLARKVAEQAIGEMLHYVGDASDIKNIILVGGGSFFFKKAINREYYRTRRSNEPKPHSLGHNLEGVHYGPPFSLICH